MALIKKDQKTIIEQFKKYFKLEDISISKRITFISDEKNNLYAEFNYKTFILTNKRNPEKFLSYKTMKFKKNYGVEFLRAIGIEKEKKPQYKLIDKEKKILNKSKHKSSLIRVFKHENFISPAIDIDCLTNINEKEELVFKDKISDQVIVLCTKEGIPTNISYSYGRGSNIGKKLRKELFCYSTTYEETLKQDKDILFWENPTLEELTLINLQLSEYKIACKKNKCSEDEDEDEDDKNELKDKEELYEKDYSEKEMLIIRKLKDLQDIREDREEIRLLEYDDEIIFKKN